jgi:hypothetical protein
MPRVGKIAAVDLRKRWRLLRRFCPPCGACFSGKGIQMAKARKAGAKVKEVLEHLWSGDGWSVVVGQLKRRRGRPYKEGHLFKAVGEKLPFECLPEVKKRVQESELEGVGVYLAHDSMGVARYGGRGDIFSRLETHKRKRPRELLYFSFFIISNKSHEREIETAILRAASGQMSLNERKVREGIKVGNVTDYESGTWFVERQKARGRRRKKKRRPSEGDAS